MSACRAKVTTTMIVHEHSVIRTADPDDAAGLVGLYSPHYPRALFLDHRRDLQAPSLTEVREALRRKEAKMGLFFVVEDKEGCIRGFCSMRNPNPETLFSEILFGFSDMEDYARPIASEVMGFLKHRAFVERRLRKLVAQCLENETAYRELLIREGFESNGVQREVLYTLGRYHDLETLTLYPKDEVPAPSPSDPPGDS